MQSFVFYPPDCRKHRRAAKAEKLELVRPDKFEEIAGEGLVAYFGARKVLCGNTKLLQRFNVEYGGYTLTESGSRCFVADNGLYMGPAAD